MKSLAGMYPDFDKLIGKEKGENQMLDALDKFRGVGEFLDSLIADRRQESIDDLHTKGLQRLVDAGVKTEDLDRRQIVVFELYKQLTAANRINKRLGHEHETPTMPSEMDQRIRKRLGL